MRTLNTPHAAPRTILHALALPIAGVQLAAIVAMLADHAAIIFCNDQEAMRQVGRLAMPFFAIAAGVNVTRTRCTAEYARRLLLFAVVSQIPFAAAFGTAFATLNIGFTLLAGVGFSSWLHDRAGWPLLAPLVLTPWVDYGLAGVALVAVASYAPKSPRIAAAACLAVSTALNGPPFILATLIATILVYPAILFASGPHRAKWLKNALYAVYPAHLALFAIASSWGT